MLAVPPGFDANNMLTMTVQTVGTQFNNDTVTRDYFDRVLVAVRAVPGVEAAAFTTQLPLSGDMDKYGVHIEAHPRANPEEDESAHRYAVTDGYLEAMKIPIVRGRGLDPHASMQTPMEVIVNEAFAKKSWPNEEALGQRVRMGSATEGPWYTVVGIVGAVRQVSLAAEEPDAFYVAERQWPYADGNQSLVVRVLKGHDAAAMAGPVRAAIWSVDKDQPIMRVATMEKLIATSEAARKFALVLFEAFAVVALILAAAGIYGVLAGVVTERLREIGVRAALGASRGDLVRMILRQGMGLTGAGVIAGVALTLAFVRVIAGMLFGVSQSDPGTYLTVSLMLGAVALLACLIPAWRAARVDPAMTLRSE